MPESEEASPLFDNVSKLSELARAYTQMASLLAIWPQFGTQISHMMEEIDLLARNILGPNEEKEYKPPFQPRPMEIDALDFVIRHGLVDTLNADNFPSLNQLPGKDIDNLTSEAATNRKSLDALKKQQPTKQMGLPVAIDQKQSE